MEPIKVGLLGFGTVGCGTYTVLRRNQEEIKRRAGRGIEIARIAVRNPAKAQTALASIDAADAGSVDVTSGDYYYYKGYYASYDYLESGEVA